MWYVMAFFVGWNLCLLFNYLADKYIEDKYAVEPEKEISNG